MAGDHLPVLVHQPPPSLVVLVDHLYAVHIPGDPPVYDPPWQDVAAELFLPPSCPNLWKRGSKITCDCVRDRVTDER